VTSLILCAYVEKQAIFAMESFSNDLLSPFWRQLFDIENHIIYQQTICQSGGDGVGNSCVSRNVGSSDEKYVLGGDADKSHQQVHRPQEMENVERVEPMCFIELFRLARCLSHTITHRI
jgi:hypothetical protein